MANYERILLPLPVEQLAEVNDAAQRGGYKRAAWIRLAIDDRLRREASEMASAPDGVLSEPNRTSPTEEEAA